MEKKKKKEKQWRERKKCDVVDETVVVYTKRTGTLHNGQRVTHAVMVIVLSIACPWIRLIEHQTMLIYLGTDGTVYSMPAYIGYGYGRAIWHAAGGGGMEAEGENISSDLSNGKIQSAA